MTMDEDFIKTLISSQELPELPDEVSGRIPDLLAGDEGQQRLVSRILPGAKGQIEGAKEYGFTFHSERLIIGKVSDGYDQGREMFTEVDNSEKLKEIMDMHLQGKALIHNKKETFLKDGTVVIWIEWLEAKKETPRTERGFLSTEELLSPERINKDASDEDDESDDTDAPFDHFDS